MGRVVMGGRRTSVTFHNVITDSKHEKPLAVFLSNVIPTSTWVTFKIEAYEVLSDSEKKSACQQKRNAEKKDTQTGKGQKPIMTHYEPKKKKTQNESLEIIVRNILNNI